MYKLNPFNYPKVKGDKDIWGNKINDIFSTLFDFINNLVDIIQSQSSAIENKVDSSVLTTKLRDKVDNSVYSQKVEDIERKLTQTLTTENLNNKLQGITSLIEGKVDTVDFQRQVQELNSSISTKTDLETLNREITIKLSEESEKIKKTLSQKVEQSTQELTNKITEVERVNNSLNSTVSNLNSTVENKANSSDLNEFIKTAKLQNTTLIFGKYNGEQVQISLPHTVSDGKGLEFTWKGTELGVRKEGDWSYSYQDLRGLKGDKGERGFGVTSITHLNNNQVRLEYGDGQSAIVEIPTVAGQQGQKGEKGEDGKGLEFKWRGTELGIRQAGTSDYIYQNLQGERGISGLTGADGVGIRNITSNQEEDTVTLQFALTNNTNKNVSFTVPQSSVGGGTASPLKVEFEEIFNGNASNLIFTKPLGNYQFLQIQNNQQTATIPAKVGAKFEFWYTHGEVMSDKLHMSSSGTYKVYGIKLRGQVSGGGGEVDLSNYYDKTQSDERYAKSTHFHTELLTQNQADRLYIPQSLGVSFVKQDTSVSFQNILAKGDIIAQGTVVGISDIRLKTDIVKIQNSLEILKKLNGYTFTMNGTKHVGVIAQEVQKVLPEAIRKTENGYLSVAYGNMIGLLIETNKELLNRIEVLEHGIKQ